jgi:hypothetical protein
MNTIHNVGKQWKEASYSKGTLNSVIFMEMMMWVQATTNFNGVAINIRLYNIIYKLMCLITFQYVSISLNLPNGIIWNTKTEKFSNVNCWSRASYHGISCWVTQNEVYNLNSKLHLTLLQNLMSMGAGSVTSENFALSPSWYFWPSSVWLVYRVGKRKETQQPVRSHAKACHLTFCTCDMKYWEPRHRTCSNMM